MSLFCATATFAQFSPADNAHLNYSSVCFEFPWVDQVVSYELILTEKSSGEKTIFTTKANKQIVDELVFGESYLWQVIGKNTQKKEIYSSAERIFSIEEHFRTGKKFVRFKEVTNNSLTRGDELLILDYAGLVINRDEEIVWYLPDLPMMSPNSGLRDLKLTDEGTFLAIIDSNAYEFDLTGRILWKAPNDGAVSHQGKEDYHHDLQKLPSGNYMVLGNEKQRRVLEGEKDTSRYEIGTIIEYNPAGKVVWQWHAKDFFTDDLLKLRLKEDGGFNLATHLNAFSVVGNFVYAGFRDANWVLKIDKTTKKVVELYGGHDSGLPNHYGKELFRLQHDATVLNNGSMAVINNDSIKDPAVVSSLVVFSLGENNVPKGEELFRFKFDFDSLCNGKSLKLGNVEELSNGNYLVNMGAIHRIFEVTPKGEITWDIFVEKLDTFKRVWRFHPQYRVALTSSLYPNEFTSKWTPKKGKGDQLIGSISLFNVGTEKNRYTVFVQQETGSWLALTEIPTIEAGQSRTTVVTIPKKHLNTTGGATLKVQVRGKSLFQEFVVRR
ncbi:MAG: aryl-sulfate sulfotransferase [Fluviicola sp.]|nr:aryl-sulfate sulfotransferase [Fluviicola sp.]